MKATSRRQTFDKADFEWSYLAIGLGALATLLFAVIIPVINWLSGATFTSQLLVFDYLPVNAELQQDVRLDADTLLVELPHASTATWLAQIGRGVLFTVVVLAVLHHLWRFMRSVAEGSPFTETNVRRLQIMAWILIIAPMVGLLVEAVYNGHLLSLAFEHGFTWVVNISNATYVVAGFGVLLALIAEVFRRGVRLEGDVDGLV